MNRISSQRLLTITYVLWQCSQNISCVSKGKGLFGPNGGSGGKVEAWFDNFGRGGEEIRNCGSNGRRGSSLFGRGGGSLTICSIESKDGLGGGGLVVVGGRSSGVRSVWMVGLDLVEDKSKVVVLTLESVKSLLGEIPKESGSEEFGVDRGAV
ncbi:hypothetical protein Tco_1499305 [Tanacetum coccineum]